MRIGLFLVFLLGLGIAGSANGYSVLTHEAIIDAAWGDAIRPLLLKRFPNTAADSLRIAHGYAFGGAIIQDMGYYPFANKFVSDLTHYVRSGDFILNMLAGAGDLNEYAFALGSLAHYTADNHGHREAVNKAVPIMYPKLRRLFGDTVTYSDNPIAHLKVEFSFDVAQVAQGHYAPDAYREFVGFEVAQSLLERAFAKTYSLELSSLLNEDLAIGTYRYTVASIIPTMTKVAWGLKKNELRKAQPSLTKKQFVYNLSRSAYRRRWGKKYHGPGLKARLIAVVFRLIPKIGPLRAFAFHPPTPAMEKMFMKSVNDTLAQYRELLAAHGQGALRLPNENFDTGAPTQPGTYKLADNTYAKLLDKLNGKPVSAELRADILTFYADVEGPFATKRDVKDWQRLLSELRALKAAGATDSVHDKPYR